MPVGYPSSPRMFFQVPKVTSLATAGRRPFSFNADRSAPRQVGPRQQFTSAWSTNAVREPGKPSGVDSGVDRRVRGWRGAKNAVFGGRHVMLQVHFPDIRSFHRSGKRGLRWTFDLAILPRRLESDVGDPPRCTAGFSNL